VPNVTFTFTDNAQYSYSFAVTATVGTSTLTSATSGAVNSANPRVYAVYAGPYIPANTSGTLLAKTTNGQTWSAVISYTAGTNGFTGSCLMGDNNNNIIMAQKNTGGVLINLSTNAVTSLPNVPSCIGTIATNGTGTWVLPGNDNIYYSTNLGTTWSVGRSTPGQFPRWIAYGNGVFVAVCTQAGANNIYYSSNGISWTANTTYFLTGTPVAYLFFSTYYNRFYLAGASAIWYSTNGQTWTSTQALTASGINVSDTAVVLGEDRNGNILLYAASGTVYYSTNGTTFTNYSSSGDKIDRWVSEINFINNTWIVGGNVTNNSINIIYSTNNGSSWTKNTQYAGNGDWSTQFLYY
jgi:hypothetical protein